MVLIEGKGFVLIYVLPVVELGDCGERRERTILSISSVKLYFCESMSYDLLMIDSLLLMRRPVNDLHDWEP